MFFAVFVFLIAGSSGVLQAQEKEESEGGVTVKGKVVQASGKDFVLDLKDLEAKLNQQVQLPAFEIPKNWGDLTPEERKSWFEKYEASEEGKAIIEKRKKLIEEAAKFELKFDKEGRFAIYDVPPGTYGLRGRTEKQIENATYVLEVFAQVQVSEDIDELLLDPIQVLATRILKPGEPTPQFSIDTFDGKLKLENKLLVDRLVLMNFWSLESPPSLQFAKSLQEAYEKLKGKYEIQLVSVCIGSKPTSALEYVKENGVKGWHGYVKNWDDPMLEKFGVRGIPAMFLIAKDGTIKTTNNDFRQLFRAEGAQLEKVIQDSIDGKNVPTQLESEASQ